MTELRHRVVIALCLLLTLGVSVVAAYTWGVVSGTSAALILLASSFTFLVLGLGLMAARQNRQLRNTNQAMSEQQQRERLMREANQGIIEFSNDLLCSIDLNGRFRFVSPASQAILGYAPEDLLGKSSLGFIVEEDREPSRQAMMSVVEGSYPVHQQFRNRYYHRSGHIITLTWKTRWSEADQTLFCVGRDISAQLEAEELAHQREAFFSVTPEIFCIVSPDNRFIEVNQAFLSVLGYSHDELIGSAYLEVIHPDDHLIIHDAINQLLTGLTVTDLEFRVFHKSGNLHWLRLNANLSSDQLIYCSARDVTHEKSVQDQLRQSEGLLKIAEQAGRLGGWMLDVESGQVSWSDGVCEIHELAPGQIPPMDKALDYYTPETRPIIENALQACIDFGIPFDIEARITTEQGRLRWVRGIGRAVYGKNGRVCRLQGAFQDISASKEASQRIRELAERQSRIFESITDAFFTLNESWAFTFANHRTEELLQRSRADLLGRSIWEVFPEAIGTPFEEHYRAAVATGESQSFEAYFEPLDLWCEVNAYPSEDGIAVYFRSINERKKAKLALENTLAELERSNRELQDFAFVASHDLQEPLRKIQTFGDRLMRDPQHFDEREQDYLKRMQSAAGRMQRLIQDLLAYSRVATRAQPMTPCDLNQLLLEVCQDLEATISLSGADIRNRPLPDVEGDATQLRQLLQNLLSNAIKFRRADATPVIEVYCEDNDESGWTLVIEDNGTGFEQQYAERMFQPFARLHNRNEYEGTGIGLAIVRKIADRHGATLSAVGNPGHGACFRIRFKKVRTNR